MDDDPAIVVAVVDAVILADSLVVEVRSSVDLLELIEGRVGKAARGGALDDDMVGASEAMLDERLVYRALGVV